MKITGNIIQVFEYENLRIGDGRIFTSRHFDALVKFNEKNNNKYYTVIHNGIRFKNYVGVIQAEGLTIEILPKADNNEEQDENIWQRVLMHMLEVCNYIKIDHAFEAQLRKRHNSLLEVYYELYLTELEELIKKGVIKKYRREQENQKALKGKLIFPKNIQKNTIHKEQFFCEYQKYDPDHLLHQILYKGLKILDRLVNNHLKDRVNRLLFEFCDFQEKYIDAGHFDRIKLDRKSQPYEKALNIAKMLILNYSSNINSGKNNMLTLLFDMNKLWEKYIFRILHDYKPDGYQVFSQKSTAFWEGRIIKPDIVIISDNNETLIIDTKWKIVDSNSPSDNDLKQIFAYNLHWKAEKSMLLYPKTYQNDSNFGNYRHKIKVEKDGELIERPNQCKLGFVSVINTKENTIKKDEHLAKEIFRKIS